MPRTSLKQHQQLARLRTLAALHSVSVIYASGRKHVRLEHKGNPCDWDWSAAEVSLDAPFEVWQAAMEKITRPAS